MALTDLQSRTIKAIVNLFETSQVLGDYAKVTVIEGDTGGLTYGRSQTTHTSGNLAALLDEYLATPGAVLTEELVPLRPLLARNADPKPPTTNAYLHNLLRAAADSPVMRDVQDRFFDRRFWQPALTAAARAKITTPLGIAAVYDGKVHGSWPLIRKRADARGLIGDIGERAWITHYVAERRAWLGGHRRKDLRNTVYRMEALAKLIAVDAWALDLPLVVRGREISAQSLFATPRGAYDGPPLRSRNLARMQPLQRGFDVRRVQLALSHPNHGIAVAADGIFGQGSERAVKAFQAAAPLRVTGVVDAAAFDALGL